MQMGPGTGSGSGVGTGAKQGWVGKKRRRVDFYSDDDEDSEEGEGGGGGGGGGVSSSGGDFRSGYGGLIPQFTVSLLNLAVESSEINAHWAAPYTTIPMDRSAHRYPLLYPVVCHDLLQYIISYRIISYHIISCHFVSRLTII